MSPKDQPKANLHGNYRVCVERWTGFHWLDQSLDLTPNSTVYRGYYCTLDLLFFVRVSSLCYVYAIMGRRENLVAFVLVSIHDRRALHAIGPRGGLFPPP